MQIMSFAVADKNAFEAFLLMRKLPFDDLSRNDNRSQSRDTVRNLDYLVRVGSSKEVLIELEGRDMPKGRVQPSKAWLKENELQALISWEEADSVHRMSLIVYAFRSTTAPASHTTTVNIYGLHYILLGTLARDFRASSKMRCERDGWATCDLRKGEFARIARPVEELLLV